MIPFVTPMLISSGGTPTPTPTPTPSSDTSVTTTAVGNLGAGRCVGVMVFRGVDNTTPMDVAATTAVGGNTGQADPPAITPSTSGAVIVAIGAGVDSTNGAAFTSSDLSNFQSPTATGGTYNGTVGMGSHAWSGSGSFDPAQFGGGYTGTSAAWAAATLALRPSGSISYVGGTMAKNNNSNSAQTVSLTSLTGGSDSAPAVGDIIIVVIGQYGTVDYNLGISTSGYTEICDLYGNDAIDCNLSVNYKIAA